MLEKFLTALTDLVGAINNLAAALKSGGVPVAAAAPAKAEKTTTDVKPDPKAEAKTEKKADAAAALAKVQAQGMALIKEGHQEAVKAVLKAVGAANFAAIKPADVATVAAELAKIKTEPSSEPAGETGAKALTLADDILPLAKEIVGKGNDSAEVKALQELLKKYKAPKVSAVDPKHFAAILPELQAILKPAASDDLV